MTKTKVKKDGINITIENNLFSKNKTTDKNEDDDIEDFQQMPEQRAQFDPFQPEPAFLGEIRNHMAEKRFYNMRINPKPVFSDMNMVHQNFLNEKENISNSYSKSIDIDDDTLSQFETAPRDESIFFTQEGKYTYKNENDAFKRIKERTRDDYLRYKKKPQRGSLKKYGLPEDFLENYEEKKREYERRN